MKKLIIILPFAVLFLSVIAGYEYSNYKRDKELERQIERELIEQEVMEALDVIEIEK